MIALIQRVTRAAVAVDGVTVGEIGRGILALVGIAAPDTPVIAERLLVRMLGYRIFPDEAGKMNQNLSQVHGGLLLVPQFTLLADTRQGTRPGFSRAADPALATHLFNHLLAEARRLHTSVAAGKFGTDMQVSLVNDGPVTFWLEAR